jgi:hypothetical protein
MYFVLVTLTYFFLALPLKNLNGFNFQFIPLNDPDHASLTQQLPPPLVCNLGSMILAGHT